MCQYHAILMCTLIIMRGRTELRVRERVNVLGEAAQADHYPRELADVADAREVRLCHVAGWLSAWALCEVRASVEGTGGGFAP